MPCGRNKLSGSRERRRSIANPRRLDNVADIERKLYFCVLSIVRYVSSEQFERSPRAIKAIGLASSKWLSRAA